MKRALRLAAVLPILWFLFWVAGIVAPLAAALWALFTWSTSPLSNAFHAHNRLAATTVGFEGERTISEECGLRLRANPDCQPCKALCAVLSKALRDYPHCENQLK